MAPLLLAEVPFSWRYFGRAAQRGAQRRAVDPAGLLPEASGALRRAERRSDLDVLHDRVGLRL